VAVDAAGQRNAHGQAAERAAQDEPVGAHVPPQLDRGLLQQILQIVGRQVAGGKNRGAHLGLHAPAGGGVTLAKQQEKGDVIDVPGRGVLIMGASAYRHGTAIVGYRAGLRNEANRNQS